MRVETRSPFEKLRALAEASARIDALHAAGETGPLLAVRDRQHARAAAALELELAAHGLSILRAEGLDASEEERVAAFFEREVRPLLTPIAVDAGHPSPRLADRTVTLVAALQDDAVAFVPGLGSALPRLVPLGEGRFLPLEEAIRLHLARLFNGHRVEASWAVRATRRHRDGALVRLEHEARLPEAALSVFVSGTGAARVSSHGLLGFADLLSIANELCRRERRERRLLGIRPELTVL